MLTTDVVLELIRLHRDRQMGVSLSAAALELLVAYINALEVSDAEHTELRASLETRSPED